MSLLGDAKRFAEKAEQLRQSTEQRNEELDKAIQKVAKENEKKLGPLGQAFQTLLKQLKDD